MMLLKTELFQCLMVISQESPNFDKSFAWAEKCLKLLGESDDIADRLLDLVPPEFPWQSLAELLGMWMWMTSDNGAAILHTTERWLEEATDERKCLIALNLDAYPFQNADQMRDVLLRVSLLSLELREQCLVLMASRQN
ncbi:MAG TPA: hypothetical protein PLB32_13655 [Acidobacteriota bacterium]|nr:hypothetical protein [Acidobacteriota bacterium]